MSRARHVDSLPSDSKTGYPEPLRTRVAGRSRRRLGDAFGLTQFGVNLTRVEPGSESALRHWHSGEDELVYMLSGELVLVTDAGEETVTAGMVVGFPAGRADGHHFINRSAAPAEYIEVGTRAPDQDVCSYPDDDLVWVDQGNEQVPGHKDGSLY